MEMLQLVSFIAGNMLGFLSL